MNQYKSSSQLKAIAKGRLLGNYGKLIGAYFLLYLILELAIIVPVIVCDITTVAGLLIFLGVMIIIVLLSSVFLVGQNYMYLSIGSGRPCKFWHMFYGFKLCPDKAIVAILLMLLICLGILFVPIAGVAFLYAYSTKIPMLSVFGTLLYIVAMVIYYIVTLKFALVFYLIIDFPNKSVIEIFKLSNKLMHGNKGRYFYITISFIPIMLLGSLSSGIAMLFLLPYMQMTYTQFYLNVVEVYRNQQIKNQENYNAFQNAVGENI